MEEDFLLEEDACMRYTVRDAEKNFIFVLSDKAFFFFSNPPPPYVFIASYVHETIGIMQHHSTSTSWSQHLASRTDTNRWRDSVICTARQDASHNDSD